MDPMIRPIYLANVAIEKYLQRFRWIDRYDATIVKDIVNPINS